MIIYCLRCHKRIKKKTKRAIRTPVDILQRTAKQVKNGTSIRKAAVNFKIDKMTLMHYINKCKSQQNPVVGYTAIILFNFVIPPEMEEDLAQHIKMLSDMFFGLSFKKCKEVVNEFDKINIEGSIDAISYQRYPSIVFTFKFVTIKLFYYQTLKKNFM